MPCQHAFAHALKSLPPLNPATSAIAAHNRLPRLLPVRTAGCSEDDVEDIQKARTFPGPI